MVKTILHELCKIRGQAIYEDARHIQGSDAQGDLRPIIFPYIELNLQVGGSEVI